MLTALRLSMLRRSPSGNATNVAEMTRIRARRVLGDYVCVCGGRLVVVEVCCM